MDIYKFEELSEKAKDVARDYLCQDYFFEREAMDSLRAFARFFDSDLDDFNIDWTGFSLSSASFSVSCLSEEEIHERLKKLGRFNPETLLGTGECKLTGYCADDDAIDGFRVLWHGGERDLNKLLQAGFDNWLNAAQADFEFQKTDESLNEMCEANEYFFTKEGELA